jgi:hypothetical protein
MIPQTETVLCNEELILNNQKLVNGERNEVKLNKEILDCAEKKEVISDDRDLFYAEWMEVILNNTILEFAGRKEVIFNK